MSRLAEGQPDVQFDFYVQSAPDASPKWTDDPTLRWDEKSSSPVKVATITIDPQPFDTREQLKLCEDLSFTPWHSLPDLEPLGQINRTRRAAYKASSILRHQTTGASRREPTIADRSGRARR